MKPTKFEYARATDVGDVSALLEQGGDNARPISGGQSLGPMMNLRVVSPSLLVDISRVPELTAIRCDHGCLTLGAAVTHATIETGVGAAETRQMLPTIAAAIAYRPVRNRGTIGGSLAHADPGADWPPVLMALGAEVELSGPAGRRTVTITDLIVDPLTTSLERSEIIVAIRIPRLSGEARWAHRKFCRKPGDFAASIAAIVIDPACQTYRAVLSSGVSPPVRLSATEECLGRSGKHSLAALDEALGQDLTKRANVERWSGHAASLHKTMVMEALREAVA